MIIQEISYSGKFCRRFKSLPIEIKKAAKSKIEIFKTNPLHPSLRFHELTGKLKGFWSISINMNYRAIFKRKEDGEIIFFIIGKHDIYKNIND